MTLVYRDVRPTPEHKERMIMEVTLIDITSRRAEAQQRLSALRASRGADMLDGKQIEHEDVAMLEAEIDALEEAEAELVQRQRAADQAARSKARDEGRAKLAKIAAERLDAMERAEKAARELSAALSEVYAKADEAAEIMRDLTGRTAREMFRGVVDIRMAGRLSAVLAPVIGTRRRLGAVLFPEALPSHKAPWREDEARNGHSEIDAILTEGTDK